MKQAKTIKLNEEKFPIADTLVAELQPSYYCPYTSRDESREISKKYSKMPSIMVKCDPSLYHRRSALHTGGMISVEECEHDSEGYTVITDVIDSYSAYGP